RQAALGDPSGHLVSRLPVEPVCRPRLAHDVGYASNIERGHDRSERIGRRLHLPARREVVVARALVADRRGRDDHVAHREVRHENTGTTRRNEGAPTERDELVEPARCEWCANPTLRDCESLPFELDLEDWKDA